MKCLKAFNASIKTCVNECTEYEVLLQFQVYKPSCIYNQKEYKPSSKQLQIILPELNVSLNESLIFKVLNNNLILRIYKVMNFFQILHV